MKHCNGHRPSQQIRDTFFCDDKLDCIDRSDETNCGKLKRVSIKEILMLECFIFNYSIIFVHIHKSLQSSIELRQPKLTRSQRDTIKTWASDGGVPKSTKCDPIMYKSAHPDECPYEDGSWDDKCNNTVTQGQNSASIQQVDSSFARLY